MEPTFGEADLYMSALQESCARTALITTGDRATHKPQERSAESGGSAFVKPMRGTPRLSRTRRKKEKERAEACGLLRADLLRRFHLDIIKLAKQSADPEVQKALNSLNASTDSAAEPADETWTFKELKAVRSTSLKKAESHLAKSWHAWLSEHIEPLIQEQAALGMTLVRLGVPTTLARTTQGTGLFSKMLDLQAHPEKAPDLAQLLDDSKAALERDRAEACELLRADLLRRFHPDIIKLAKQSADPEVQKAMAIRCADVAELDGEALNTLVCADFGMRSKVLDDAMDEFCGGGCSSFVPIVADAKRDGKQRAIDSAAGDVRQFWSTTRAANNNAAGAKVPSSAPRPHQVPDSRPHRDPDSGSQSKYGCTVRKTVRFAESGSSSEDSCSHSLTDSPGQSAQRSDGAEQEQLRLQEKVEVKSDEEEDTEIMRKLRECGVCQQGFQWRRCSRPKKPCGRCNQTFVAGYQCAGDNHFICEFCLGRM